MSNDVQFSSLNDLMNSGMGGKRLSNLLLNSNMDHNVLRPFIGDDGRYYVNKRIGNETKAVLHNEGTLRKLEWELLDSQVIQAAKPRLKLWDVLSQKVPYTLNDPLSVLTLQYQTQSDISEATISMDGLRTSEADRPTYDLVNLPIPVIHKDFSFPLREIAASRRGGTPLNISTAALASRRVAEMAEQLAVGSITYTAGGNTVYGLTNFPSRATFTMTAPTAGGWTPTTTVNEVLQMMQVSRDNYNYGPWDLFVSVNWPQYLDRDMAGAYKDKTLRQRLLDIEGINSITSLDYMSGYQMVLVQMTTDNIQGVKGMMPTVLQWDEAGGMEVRFKVMAIMVPWLKADKNANCGIVHGS